MGVSGVGGPGAIQFGRGANPPEASALIQRAKQAFSDYADSPSESHATALVGALRELKAAMEKASPTSYTANSYKQLMAIMSALPQGNRIRELIEGHASVSDVGAKVHEQLQNLTTDDLRSQMTEASKRLRSDH